MHIQKNALTAEQLQSLAAHVEGLSAEEKARRDMIKDDMGEGVGIDSNGEQIEQMEQMNAMAALRPLPVNGLQDDGFFDDSLPMDGQIIGQAGPNAGPNEGPNVGPNAGQIINPQNQVVYPASGGMAIPNFADTSGTFVRGASIPGAGPMIAVRTDRDAFESDGIYLEGGNRPIRRNVYRNPMGQMGQMGQMQRMGTPMSAMMERFAPMEGGHGGQGSSHTVTVVKLE